MPFVIRCDGGYLRKAQRSYTGMRRTIVSDINEATVWSKVGDAKNAIHAAKEDLGRRLKNAAVIGVEVKILILGDN